MSPFLLGGIMSFAVTFYRFSKKVNSTKQPPLGSRPQVLMPTVLLKDDTDILNPTLIIDNHFVDAVSEEFFIPNYVEIPQFGRYYYIVNMTWIKGVWHIQCKVDVLASYRTEIGDESLYVLRSASSSNGDIVDNTYPTETDATLDLALLSSPWSFTPPDISYVLGIAGDTTQYFNLTPSELITFLTYIFSSSYASALSTFASAYPNIQYDANPLQFVLSIKWFPFYISGGTPVTTIQTGYVSVPVTAKRLADPYLYNVPKVLPITDRHPQASVRGSYLNYEPFSRYSLTFPPYGEFDIDAVNVAVSSQLTLDVTVDLRTGGSTLTVLDENSNRMNRLHADIGVDYQVSQIVSKGFGVAQIANAGAGFIGNALAWNVGGAISSALGGVEDYAKSKIPKATTIGSNGGVDALFGSIALQSTFLNLVSEDNTRKGRPLYAVRTINTLSGFIQVEKADVDIATAEGEQSEIRSYMEGGFYYE